MNITTGERERGIKAKPANGKTIKPRADTTVEDGLVEIIALLKDKRTMSDAHDMAGSTMESWSTTSTESCVTPWLRSYDRAGQSTDHFKNIPTFTMRSWRNH
jgi:hypothetical protein